MPYSFLVANIKLLKPTAWEQLKSPCLWEEISTFLLLGFYGILLLYFIRKMAYAVHMFTTKATEKDAEMYPDNARLSLCSKVSIVSSTLLLSVHLTSLCLLVKGNKISCDHYVPALAAEILQVISWIITIIVLCRTLTKNYLIFPGILRFWWVCSFLITACHVAVAFNFVMDNHGQLRIQEYADFLGFFASVSLLVISIQGKMKIAHDSARSNLTEPLLNGETGKKFKGKVESLYSKATLLDLVTFSWLNPLFVIGKKKPLEQDEIPEVDVKDSAAFLSQCFNENLKQAKEEEGITNSTSVYKAIFQLAWKKAAVNALFAVISAFASYVGPYLINDFVVFLSEKKHSSLKTGYLLALGFLGAKVVETIAQRQWIFGARQLGLRLRAAMISQIYQKGLMLSCQARQSHTSGEIMNYMSVDVQRISDFVWYVNTLWMLPVQISLAIYVLHTSLGLGSLAGLAATLVVMSCNIPLTRTQKKYQSKIMDAKDARMKATSEILRNMKSIKLQAWDNQFRHKLESLRNIESSWIWKSLRLGAVGAFIFWGSPTFISIITFGACLLMGIPLTAGSVLSALATFRMLQDPIFSLPDLLNVVAQAKVSADRVSSYLQGEEIQQDAVKFVSKDKTPYAIDIEGGKLSWDPNSETPTLDNINLQVTRGMKVAICGTVGSGKSSLLSGLIGEIPKISGTVKISGSKAYVPQTPWILTGNIKENILFGSPYDAAKYDRTVKACALLKDFELFPQGDLTEIGERGINMSGGQKQRIQIARAVYQDADIYLLDDPFSAVDAHTGTQLFQECLMEVLGDKTIFYVTHQVEFLPAADLILVMQDGKISEAGTFKELLKQNIGFEVLVGAHSQALDSVLKVEGASGRTSKISLPQNVQSSAEQIQTRDEEEEKLSPEMKEKEGRLIQDEEREKGSIGKEVYWAYLTIVKRGILVPVIVLAQSSFQVLQIASNYWMAWACPTSGDAAPVAEMDYVLLVYAILSIISSICVLVRASVLAYAGLSTAQKLFENMLHSVLRAPMSFFDSTPTGRILNRASSDQSVLDLEMAQRLGWAAFSMIQLLGTIAVMSQVAWEVFLIFIPVTAICIWYKQYYIPTARELARLSEIQKAPILHHFGESLSGAATIRAFDQKDRFINANLVLVDGFSRPWFHNVSAMEWLSFRLNQLSNFVFAFSLVLLVSLPDGIINPSIAGLAVTYGINLNVLQASVIWNICNAENKMISVERVLQYTELNSEAPMIIDDCRPPNNWPTTGTITFQNLQIRYAEHLPSVLKKITCTLPGMKKIGVVGRTGSGKSTLIQALFRIVEPKEGSIIIDDVDICKIGLHDLRSRLSIIPQDPTMFDGTVRINLDPLQQHSDNDIWEALDKCQLGDLVRAKEGRLESTVVENGENWSVGLSWYRDCRAVDVMNVMSTGNGGTIELLYMQLYALTTLAPARDFWLMRYTSLLEDGSVVICERSLNNTQNGPSMPSVQHFVRAEIMPSGYLIRPCEGGGSIIHVVDHMDLEPWRVPEVLRPLYESSTLLAQRTTMAALRQLRQISQEISQPNVTGFGRRPAALRALSQRLNKGFNEAVNGFMDEGWSMMDSDGIDDVTLLVNSSPSKMMGENQFYSNGFPSVGTAVLCARASMLLQNVPPAVLLRFLREHRSEWADSGIDAYAAAAVKAAPCTIPVARTGCVGGQVILPLAHTIENEEFMEVVRLENLGHYREDMFMPGDIFMLQLCSGVDENAVGACAELVFAPIDASFSDDAPLLPSGFRIIPIDSSKDVSSPKCTLDLTSALEVGAAGNKSLADNSGSGSGKSVMTIAFQFAFEIHLQESVASMARQYVRSIISSVQRVASALSPSRFGSLDVSPLSPGTPEAQTLARWICQSYRFYLGVELLKPGNEGGESILKSLWSHSDAILCCSLKALPVFTFANQAGLDMLETTLVALQDITLEKIFDEQGRKTLFTELPQIMQQGFICLQGGICMSSMGRPISYERAVAWKVFNDAEDAQCMCFMFINWSFV